MGGSSRSNLHVKFLHCGAGVDHLCEHGAERGDLAFTLLYTYRGFKLMEQAMANPVKIPALVEQPPGSQRNGSTSSQDSPQASQQPTDAVATPVEDVIQPAQVLHVVAICRCTEPVEVLEETIDNLATHSNRACYIILLCLEAKDKQAASVGESLVRKYAGVFHRVMYAIHPGGIEWEVPGKSANVNWGARAAYASLEAEMGSRILDRLVITVADCDAKVSEHYFNELSVRFAAAAREKREVFWAPPMLFDEEAAELAAEANGLMSAQDNAAGPSVLKTDPVEMLLGRTGKAILKSFLGGAIPGPVKVADQLWGIFVLQNLTSVNWVRLPCSTYSVGMKLIASVGFWDAGVESVPEDYHTSLKLYWGTSGRARCEPIYHPVLYQHIDGGSWFNTVYQRYQQGVRHMWGATDVAYIFWLCLRVPTVPWTARIRLVMTVLDVHVNCGVASFFSTYGYLFVSVMRPGWLASGDGKWFFSTHEFMLMGGILLSLLIGCVYEWFAGEMIAACKRPMPCALPYGAALGLAGSPMSGGPSFQSPVGPLGMGQGAKQSNGEAARLSSGSSGSSSHMSRSPSSPAGAGCPSPVHMQHVHGEAGPMDGAPLANLSSALDAAGPVVVPVPMSASGGFVSIDTGSGVHSPSTASPYNSPGRTGRDRAMSAALPRGRIPVKDRTVLGALATCTATSVWEYLLKLLPWVWSPVCCVLYLNLTAASAQTQLLWKNRMRPHVSPKSIPTPSATPRSQPAHGSTPGSATPLPRMQSLAADSSAWERSSAGGNTPVVQAGRSIRLQLPNAAFGGPRNPSSGQFQTLLGGTTPHATPRVGYSSSATAEHRGDSGQNSPGRHGSASAWA